MKAMILAAGLGTRLRPLTNSRPKALVSLFGISLLEFQIRKLIQSGIRDIVINIHHFPGQIIDFVKRNNAFGINIQFSDESDKLLDTGGGLIKARKFLAGNSPFLLINTDILSDININEMLNFHNQHKAIATLAVRKRKSSRYLLFDTDNVLCGWKNNITGEKISVKPKCKEEELAFSGIHIIDQKFFEYKHPETKHSIINSYLRLAKTSRIMGYRHDKDLWYDIGKHSTLIQLSKDQHLRDKLFKII
jgi:NDP-sugar pyrophosphorylase family protein